ncbi:FHA domain-containing protein [Archangium sp.]|uniref:FHA domain-containing protein n=1 Tax=Archangium sp. TaxID=1872627 RepID=UPI00286AECB2|nr:FHA domain-containing protein [Archangium sp.]
MTPPKPKRPPRSPRVPGDSASRPEPEVELPFDDDEVAPLRADDPRPQRVPQFPAGPRRRPRRGAPGASREGRDRELPARFESGEYEDPGHSPAFLYVERGPGAGQLLPLKQGVLVLGRASTSDLRLQHPSISRRHAQLTRRGDRLFIKDLGSQNGTYVNRVRLGGEVELHPGDELALGNALLRLRGPGPTPEGPRASVRRTDSSALRVGMSPRRLVLLAAAVGSLAAVFLTLAAVRLVRGRSASPESPVDQVQATQLVAEPEAVPSQDSEETVLAEPEPEPQTPTPAPGARTRRESGPPPLSAQAIASTGKAKEPAPRPREVPRVTKSEKSEALRKVAAASAPVSNPEAEAEALARYEAGNVEAALTLARGARLEPLASTLARFRDEWNAGNAALSARDSASAAQHLSAALEIDQELSKGWSTYAVRIRKALTQVQDGSSQGSTP